MACSHPAAKAPRCPGEDSPVSVLESIGWRYCGLQIGARGHRGFAIGPLRLQMNLLASGCADQAKGGEIEEWGLASERESGHRPMRVEAHQFHQQDGREWSMDYQAGICFRSRGIGSVIVDAMRVERES